MGWSEYADVITLPVDWIPRLTNTITNIQASTKHRHKCHRTSPRFSMLMPGSSFINANLQHTDTFIICVKVQVAQLSQKDRAAGGSVLAVEDGRCTSLRQMSLSFRTKTLCTRLSLTEIHFDPKWLLCVFEPTLWAYGPHTLFILCSLKSVFEPALGAYRQPTLFIVGSLQKSA